MKEEESEKEKNDDGNNLIRSHYCYNVSIALHLMVLFGVAAAVLVLHITKKLIHAAFTLVVFVLLLYLRGALPAILANFH